MFTLPTGGQACGAGINNQIKLAVSSGKSELVLSEGLGGIETAIVLPKTPFRLLGSGRCSDTTGTRLRRIADGPMVRIEGTNTGNSLSGMVQRPELESLLFDGNGFTQPMLSLKNCYEAKAVDVHTRGWYVTHIYRENDWDSRFDEGSSIGGGCCDGLAAPASPLEKRLGFSVGTPMIHLVSPDTQAGADTCNNDYWYGWRFESSPNNGIMLLGEGNNGVQHVFTACKFEGLESARPLVVMVDQSGVNFAACWLMGGGTGGAQYAIGAMAAGLRYATMTNPAVALFDTCRYVTGDFTGGYVDGGQGVNVAPLRTMISLNHCDHPAISLYVIQGLSALIQPGAAIISGVGVTNGGALSAGAQPWALQQVAAGSPIADVLLT